MKKMQVSNVYSAAAESLAVDEHSKKDVICFYHSPCNDGMAARAALSLAFKGRMNFEPVAPYSLGLVERCRDRKVVCVDLVPKEIREIQKVATRIFIIDHHSGNEALVRDLTQYANVRAFFSNARSAAFLTYQWAFATSRASPEERAFSDLPFEFELVPDERVPRFLHLIDDRDRFINAYEDTKALTEWLFFVQDTLQPDELEERYRRFIFHDEPLGPIISSANTLAQVAKNATSKALRRINVQELFIGDQFYVVGVVNSNANSSDIGNAVLDDPRLDFSLVWSGNGPCSFSARSKDDRVSVSDIAKMFGGGGHRNASGFSYPYSTVGTKTFCGAKHVKKTTVKRVFDYPTIVLNSHPSQTLASHLLAKKRYVDGLPITVGRFLSGGNEDPVVIVMWRVVDCTTKITIFSETEAVATAFAQAAGISAAGISAAGISGGKTSVKIQGIIPSWLF